MPIEPAYCPMCGEFYTVAYHWDAFTCSACGNVAHRGDELHGYRTWEAKAKRGRAEIVENFVEFEGENAIL